MTTCRIGIAASLGDPFPASRKIATAAPTTTIARTVRISRLRVIAATFPRPFYHGVGSILSLGGGDMPGLARAIEAAVRAAYLGWTGEEHPDTRAPIGSFLDRPARLVPWSEIVASMEAATDISGQVREEVDRTKRR